MPPRRSRRSTDIIAPGFGTQTDIERLARDLSEGSAENPISTELVLQLMTSKGRGRRRGAPEPEVAVPASAASSAWADFMKEEGVANEVKSNEATKRSIDDTTEDQTGVVKTGGTSRAYELDFHTKKAKPTPGLLVQSGTLNSAIVGRDKKLLNFDAPYACEVPTILKLPVKFNKVYSAGHACHTLAISEAGEVYGWGRNEQGNLGSELPANVFAPVVLPNIPTGKVEAAAVGKGHSLLLIDGAVYSVGSNKVGQCGFSGLTEQVHTFRKAKFSGNDEPKIVQIACGEAFSVALSEEGHIYTTGSAEFGQLGNGATGEHFITANKLAFANSHAFTRRNTFCHAPSEQLHKNNDKTVKVVPIDEDVRIQAIACGKLHTIALEAESPGSIPRLFSWGCGNYGVLGHGVQADEYLPRVVGALASKGVRGAKFITSGQSCNLLLTQQGHVYYWGKHRTVGEATMRPTLIDALANNEHVVTSLGAGGQTVVCSTANAQTVAWGMGGHGELGLGTKKSSSKPAFVEALDGVQVLDIACGYGHTAYIVDESSAKKMRAIEPAEATASL